MFFSNGEFANPWHESYSTVFFCGIESGTKDLWHTLIDMCSKYMTKIHHFSELELLQRQIQWHLGSWNTWCDHEKQSFHIELNEELHKLEGYEIELPLFANFDTAQSIVSLNHKLSDLVDVLSLAGYSVEDMASAPLIDNMKKVCHNRETLRKKISEIEDCVAEYNKEAKNTKLLGFHLIRTIVNWILVRTN